MSIGVSSVSTSLAFDLVVSYLVGATVFLVVVTRLAWLSGDGGRASWRWTARVALLAGVVGAGLWWDARRPGGLTPNEALSVEAGAVCIAIGVVLAAAVSLGWSPVGGRTSWPVVAVGATGLAGLAVVIVLSGPLPEAPPDFGLLLAAAAVGALAGLTRPTVLDGALHGVLVAGGATLVLVWRLAYEVGTVSGPTDVVLTVGVVVPAVACLVGGVGGGLGGAVATGRRGRLPGA